jgi:hypothetical protein
MEQQSPGQTAASQGLMDSMAWGHGVRASVHACLLSAFPGESDNLHSAGARQARTVRLPVALPEPLRRGRCRVRQGPTPDNARLKTIAGFSLFYRFYSVDRWRDCRASKARKNTHLHVITLAASRYSICEVPLQSSLAHGGDGRPFISLPLPRRECAGLSKALPKCVTPDPAMPMRGKKTVRSGQFARFMYKPHLPQEMIPPIQRASLRAIFPLIPHSNFTGKETL